VRDTTGDFLFARPAREQIRERLTEKPQRRERALDIFGTAQDRAQTFEDEVVRQGFAVGQTIQFDDFCKAHGYGLGQGAQECPQRSQFVVPNHTHVRTLYAARRTTV
jgi:hypothetical protein